ncbi:hypothetical protein JAAARDRAFT_176325 [Jaapia argillacea MUCL 33604]|uniref:Uncharacterized protein n=1 Tax=Jaapia argillacea MUCL 33604 TaxID=933084 RepID=A0A067Q4I6_9AGAM|nr:hypothetical protein JAAARDRAFT_176325 [Jaapia argillacea MUCL 33604]
MTRDTIVTIPKTPYVPPPWEPREYLQGGFFLTTEETLNWATRLSGRTFSPATCLTARRIINDRVKPYGVYFSMVGEDLFTQWMVVTQHGVCPGGTAGMDPSKIPQLEEGKREAMARELLQQEGLDNLKFVTFLSGEFPDCLTLPRRRRANA